MAFIKTSDSIIIDATLTEKGRKLMARGKFDVSKFAFGDDEIDYELYDFNRAGAPDYYPALLNTQMFEAYSDRTKNIQYGLNSFDKGILYLRQEELSDPSFDPIHPHAFLMYLPILKINEAYKETPQTVSGSYVISVNDETTSKIKESSPNLRILESNNIEKRKFIVETGITDCGVDGIFGTVEDRERYIVEKFLLDKDFLIYADNRLITKILGITPNSEFRNYPSGKSIINFEALAESIPISLENQFDNYATFLVRGIDNMISDFDRTSSPLAGEAFSSINGPRGTVTAFNVKTSPGLRINSSGTRDFRYSKFGYTDQAVFGDSNKFDYIDTTIYILGATSNSRVQVPIRIMRFSGT